MNAPFNLQWDWNKETHNVFNKPRLGFNSAKKIKPYKPQRQWMHDVIYNEIEIKKPTTYLISLGSDLTVPRKSNPINPKENECTM